MNKIIEILIELALAAILLVGAYFYGRYTNVPSATESPSEWTYDTLKSISIDTVYVPVEKIVYKIRKNIDTVYLRDTVMIYEQKVYEDTISRIWISGFSPNIDSIEYRIPRDTTYIYSTHTINAKQSFWTNRFVVTAGLGVGYGLITKKPDVYVGIVVGIRLY